MPARTSPALPSDPAGRPVPPAEVRTARRRRLVGLRRATRVSLVRRGLRQTHRPSVPQRRRALALATSTGLTAPLLVLDGLPTALEAPNGPAWDDLGTGSAVVAASTTLAAAPPVAPTRSSPTRPAIADPETAHLARATPWVRAAGIPVVGLASADDVRSAEEQLGTSMPGPIDGRTAERLELRIVQRAEDVVRALGLLEGSRGVRPADVLAAAAVLDVPAPDGCTPDLVAAVVAAGADVVRTHLDRAVRPYAAALGLDVGTSVDPVDVRAVAAELGLTLPDVPGGADAAALHAAWLRTLAPRFDRLGVPTGEVVDHDDVVALARALGADVDGGVGPARISELLDELEAHQAEVSLVPYGRVGGVTLHLPATAVVHAGWHESSAANALPAEDLGAPVVGELPSRGRGTHARSAIDVAVPQDAQVLAPVSGTVVEVTPYMLYGEHPDLRVRIRPDDDPSLLVTMLHMTGAQVATGDRVEVGQAVAAQSNRFPFQSQIDAIVGALPHVHVEVREG